jgi:beta-glucanase (GH16 family)
MNHCAMKLLVIFVISASIYISLAHEILFEDNFDENFIDKSKWKFEQTLAGGHDWQFQWFVENQENAFTRDGILHIKPTLTADKFGEEELFKKKVEIDEKFCSASHNYGCSREGSKVHILNPIRSASIQTKSAFKYGTVEIRAKLPAGDWLRPSIKLLPKNNFYGDWPRSGEIDLVEARGNRNLFNEDDESIGIDKVTTTLHYGPSYDLNDWENSHFTHESRVGFNENFHVYKLDWNENGMRFLIDDKVIGIVRVKENETMWDRGFFEGKNKDLPNPWTQGSPIAPFDKEFYIVIGLAVGGVSDYFSDNFENRNNAKPWPNSSQKAPLLFWRAKDQWYKTWTSSPDGADFKIDYVKVYRNKSN